MPVAKFTRHMANLYADYIELKLKVGERAYNNYIRMLKGMFKHLVIREYILDNPFQNLEYKKVKEKKRRNFLEKPKQVMAKYLFENDFPLFRLVLLMYYCALRIEDCQNLKLRYFDLKNGLIILPEDGTKNDKRNHKTIPKSILHFFTDPGFSSHPLSYYAFGQKLVPCEFRSSQNEPYNRHRKTLQLLIQKKLIKDIKGLTLVLMERYCSNRSSGKY